MTNSLQPLAINQRDQSLDVLRGFALAGVLFVFCVSDIGSSPTYTSSVADDIVSWFKYILIEGRMYGMLIVIFGYGFYVQLEKAKKQQASLVPAFSRRLFGLLIIGFIHAILFSTRDILMFYAIAGILLLAVRKLNNRQLLLMGLVIFFLVFPLIIKFLHMPFNAFALVEPNELIAHIRHNWQFFLLYNQFYTIYLEMFVFFTLGFCLGRMGLLQKLKNDGKFRRRVLLITGPASAVFIYLTFFGLDLLFPEALFKNHPWVKWPVITAVRFIVESNQLLCVVFYATCIISIYVTDAGKKWLSPLGMFGRIALSNYLIQSLILIPYLLFFNKFKNLPPFEGFILFLIVFSLQVLFSVWWTRRFTLGPVEWVLRSFTYWKWQNIKRSVPVEKNLTPSYQIKNN